MAVREESRAFVAVRLADRAWVVDLPLGASTVGRSAACAVQIDDLSVAPRAATLVWDGARLSIEDAGGDPPTFVNGKRPEGRAELMPGDEVSIGAGRLVFGIATTPAGGSGRRTLTHHELKERLAEEMARASRSGRPTTLVMAQASPGEGGQLATTALELLRAGDVVGAYAHDELELVLPDTPADVARSVVERIFLASGTDVVAGLAVAPADGDHPERLLAAARSALARAQRDGVQVERPPAREPTRVTPVAEDPRTRQLVEQLTALAVGTAPVLLSGEASAGKGVFARVLHDASPRAGAAFVVIRCATLRDDEAFTRAFGGADGTNGAEPGVLAARGGTLFLDEVGELAMAPQARLAALLSREGPALRVVASTHRDLDALVRRGAFEPALHASLHGPVIEVPALRDRPGDIVPLAEGFALDFSERSPEPFTPGALARLRSYPWPGNVLELRNAVERAVRLAQGAEILAEHLAGDTLPSISGEGRLREHVDSIERDAIVKALAENNHNQTHAAKRLGISRRALIYKMEKYGLKSPPGMGKRG